MPSSAACRIKKAFSGLAPRTGLTALTVILLKYSAVTPMIPEALAAISYTASMKTHLAFYGWAPKKVCTSTMPPPRVSACYNLPAAGQYAISKWTAAVASGLYPALPCSGTIWLPNDWYSTTGPVILKPALCAALPMAPSG